jgi:predicted naringenin-chalcone synthase
MHEQLFFGTHFYYSFSLSYISAIETAVPDYCFTQQQLASFYAASTTDVSDQRKIRIVAAKTGIEHRYSVIGDFDKHFSDYSFFPANALLLPEPSLSERMALYKQNATLLSLKAIRKIDGFDTIKSKITHLITVTCTGLFAPGLDVELMRDLDLAPSVQRSSVNFMGCNAAVIALRNADAICRSQPDAQVLVVCTELCTIHFQKRYNEDYLLSNLLFGDGAAAVLVGGKPLENASISVHIDQFDSLILHKGYHDMAWQLSETGFIMNLSSYVPGLISENMATMLESIDLYPDTIDHWAIHPGGKRILDDFAGALNLSPQQLEASYDVLKEYGNMSSPTILFVLKQLFGNGNGYKNDRIFAAAFGPGLSIETMQLSYV